MNKLIVTLIFSLIFATYANSQEITQFLDFNGRFDFTMFGNSNNIKSNSIDDSYDCNISNKSSSSAEFMLPPGGTKIERAILYWSGSGSGDWDVKFSGPNGLSNQDISAQKQFKKEVNVQNGPQPYFSAAHDVTELLRTHGNGTYTLSDLNADRSSDYCSQTLYSGWVIVVIYEDPSLPLNSVKLYDGFIGFAESTINFNLGGLKIIEPDGAKLAFVVWEGDNLANLGSEGMRVNNNSLTNSINPLGELFNSTNSFTEETTFNMDMDFFDISSYVSSGDTDIKISMTAGNDVVFLNIYAITFNNELPDATVKINSHTGICNEEDITFTYTVYNKPANDTLAANLDISFYAKSPNGVFLGTQKTPSAILIGDSIVQTITLSVPFSLGDHFDIYAIADAADNEVELKEDNNEFVYNYYAPVSYYLVDDIGICQGDTLYWGGMTFTEAISQDYSFNSIFGCDSIVHLNLTVQDRISTDINYEMCQNSFYVMPLGDTIISSGDFVDVLTSQYGCDSIVNVHVTFLNENNFIDVSGAEVIDLGYSTPISIATNFNPDSIQWTPAISVACDSCHSTNAFPSDKTIFTAYIFDEYNCLLKDSIEIDVFKRDEIFIPNAFSPNGDGFNDYLKIETDKDVKEILSFHIFDRWGTMVYDGSQKFNDQKFIWNGTYKGKKLENGVFIYQAVVLFRDDRTKLFSGDVTLIR